MGRSKRDTGNWLMTYSDLVTLLLVFFVLLYMLTPGVDESTFDSFISHFQKSIGVIDETSVLDQQSSSRESYREEIVQRWEVVEDFLEEHGLSAQVNIEHVPEGVKITLSDSLTFMSGSAELLPEARSVLSRVAELIDGEVESTEAQGHTDDVPISRDSFYQTNWHLGAARAVSVVQFIQSESGLAPDRFKASSFGEFRPVADNSTPRGRRQNRRVEIYVRYAELVKNPGNRRLIELEEQFNE